MPTTWSIASFARTDGSSGCRTMPSSSRPPTASVCGKESSPTSPTGSWPRTRSAAATASSRRPGTRRSGSCERPAGGIASTTCCAGSGTWPPPPARGCSRTSIGPTACTSRCGTLGSPMMPRRSSTGRRRVPYPYANGHARWTEVARGRGVIHGPVSRLPAPERASMEAAGIRSVERRAVHVGGAWWGYIAFDDCAAEREWQPAEIDSIRVVANTLGAAIDRERSARRLDRCRTAVPSDRGARAGRDLPRRRRSIDALGLREPADRGDHRHPAPGMDGRARRAG